MVIDLTREGTGDFEVKRYADGQLSLLITPFVTDEEIYIKSRLASYEDIILALSAKDILDHMGKECHLIGLCLLGQRSDRRFHENQSFDLKIICKMLGEAGFKSIRLFHPHSDVTASLLEAYGTPVIVDTVEVILHKMKAYKRIKESTLISPDAGAYKWVQKLGEKFNLPVIASNKSRNLDTGLLTTAFSGNVTNKRCLIVDDYCDGGRTFIALAEHLKMAGAESVDLLVAHGLFSYGFAELEKYIDAIYTSMSLPEAEAETDYVTRYYI